MKRWINDRLSVESQPLQGHAVMVLAVTLMVGGVLLHDLLPIQFGMLSYIRAEIGLFSTQQQTRTVCNTRV